MFGVASWRCLPCFVTWNVCQYKQKGLSSNKRCEIPHWWTNPAVDSTGGTRTRHSREVPISVWWWPWLNHLISNIVWKCWCCLSKSRTCYFKKTPEEHLNTIQWDVTILKYCHTIFLGFSFEDATRELKRFTKSLLQSQARHKEWLAEK